MDSSVKLQKIEDELKALKVIQPLNGGALTKDGATATWSGTFDKNNPISDFSLLAAFRATYTRTDGIDKPPLVRLAFRSVQTVMTSVVVAWYLLWGPIVFCIGFAYLILGGLLALLLQALLL